MSLTKYDPRELQMSPVKYHTLVAGGAIGVLAVANCLYCVYKVWRTNNPQVRTNLFQCGLFTLGAGLVIAGTLIASSTFSNSMHR